MIRVKDYIAEPRVSGYRGLHVIVVYGRERPRPIEIQLRTESMHRWATTVEDISGSRDVNYKQDGTSAMQNFLECYARFLEHRELGLAISGSLVTEYRTLFAEAFQPEMNR